MAKELKIGERIVLEVIRQLAVNGRIGIGKKESSIAYIIGR